MSATGPTKSQLRYRRDYPSRREFPHDSLLIFDQRLKKNSAFKRWAQEFPLQYPVTAGEQLKDLRSLPRHAQKILSLTKDFSTQNSCLVIAGGGSVGDFGGFIASILKRGLPLVHLPSTWLAAMDSAHGGKTALNVSGAKNQVGTFYPAETIYLVKRLLVSQPSVRAEEARGELVKMALLDGGNWAKKFLAQPVLSEETFWRLLPQAIRAKYKIVEKDPYERRGYRRLLNLGHTVGHVLESFYHLPHGIAVHHGLQFAVDWSYQTGAMREKTYLQLQTALPQSRIAPLPVAQFKRFLLQDKKRDSKKSLVFVFVRRPGTAFLRSVEVTQLLHFAKKTGWIR